MYRQMFNIIPLDLFSLNYQMDSRQLLVPVSSVLVIFQFAEIIHHFCHYSSFL